MHVGHVLCKQCGFYTGENLLLLGNTRLGIYVCIIIPTFGVAIHIYCRYCNSAKYILINTKQCKNMAGCMFCKCNWEVGSIPVMY